MTLDGIELPDDLLWVDEFDWNPVAQDIDRSLTGALMIQEQAKLYGRPITLTGGDEAGWVSRETVNQLTAVCEQTNKTMTLVLPDNNTFTVIFNRSSTPIIAQPLLPSSAPALNSFYYLTLNLIALT